MKMKRFKTKQERLKIKEDRKLNRETIEQLSNRLISINKQFVEKTDSLETLSSSMVDKKLFLETQQQNDSKILDLQKNIYNELNSKFEEIVKELFAKNQEFINAKNNEIIDIHKNISGQISEFNTKLIDYENIKNQIDQLAKEQANQLAEIQKAKLLGESFQDAAIHLIEDKIQSEKVIKEVANFGSKAILDAFNDELSQFPIKEQKTFVDAIRKILENKNILSKEKPVEEKIKPDKLSKDEILHKTYAKLKNTVLSGVIPMVVGPAGSGKSHAMEQLARDLGLNFYMANRIQNTFELVGFVDAAGNYVTTQFYEAFTKGGLFFFDEVDASSPEALVTINAAVAQRHMAFPGHPENVKMHNDFKAVVAGNTYGTGSTLQYTGRNKLDAATLDRFMVIDWNYDEKLEDQKISDKQLLNMCWTLRSIVNQLQKEFNQSNKNRDNNPYDSIIISTRGIENLESILKQEKVISTMTKEELFKSKFFASAKKDILNRIYENLKTQKTVEKNPYYKNIEAILAV